jgi:ATP-dependent metalloprotease FtsH
VPKGVIFSGPPGVGKTMLARAIANEAGVPFFYASGAQFDEIFVGMGALRIRELFKKARKHPAAIIFIDELDAMGQSRAFQLGPNGAGTHTLNQFLTELDGFKGSGIVAIGATNMVETLDSALTRPGRFDRLVHVPQPSLDGRKQILAMYLKGVRCDATVNADDIARSTIEMSGADLAQIVNEASLLAVRDKRTAVGQQDLLQAIQRKALGIEYNKTITPAELRATAYHEAGHALAAATFTPEEVVQKVSIIPTGRALGYTWHVAQDEQHSVTRDQALARIKVAYGGYCAESLVLGTTTSGVRGDLETIGRLAHQMVWQWGMGPVRYGVDPQTVSPGTRQELEAAERELTNRCHDEVMALLAHKRDLLEGVAQALLERETLTADEFRSLIAGEVVAGQPAGH